MTVSGSILEDPRVVKGDDCWLWTGRTMSKGYGVVYLGNQRYELVHRLAYKEQHGPIQPGLTVDHLCHNRDLSCQGGPTCKHRRCINGDHLEAVTNVENLHRGLRRGPQGEHCRKVAAAKRARTNCPRGHPWTDGNTYIRRSGIRMCRTCAAAASARRTA